MLEYGKIFNGSLQISLHYLWKELKLSHVQSSPFVIFIDDKIYIEVSELMVGRISFALGTLKNVIVKSFAMFHKRIFDNTLATYTHPFHFMKEVLARSQTQFRHEHCAWHGSTIPNEGEWMRVGRPYVRYRIVTDCTTFLFRTTNCPCHDGHDNERCIEHKK